MKTLTHFIKSLIKACPYTFVGRQCRAVFKGKKTTDLKYDDKATRFRKGMKTGRNISLVGVFCPFFWYALLSGASTNLIVLNALHSSAVVLLGLLVVLVNYIFLLNSRRKG
ncbi:hypothetical protein [Pseudozobellia thermophila]|uniref:Uncharacterized protein n=1 Tax=Pseudozobellia thermophila TaxID=192903 RepID=A0A1M6NDD8_9FLAO|nr:hypothetical protein [Pseudozobellia thermophila]SHJ93717.1 hypothetical protein SAMN04488513_11317 [Pseudozobellia thermophila]